MRNFTTSSPLSATYVVRGFGSKTFTNPAFVRVQEAMVIAMGSDPRYLSSSEEAALADFVGWVKHNLEADAYVNSLMEGSGTTHLEAKEVRPVFVYVNLNEGHSVTVIWYDAMFDLKRGFFQS